MVARLYERTVNNECGYRLQERGCLIKGLLFLRQKGVSGRAGNIKKEISGFMEIKIYSKGE